MKWRVMGVGRDDCHGRVFKVGMPPPWGPSQWWSVGLGRYQIFTRVIFLLRQPFPPVGGRETFFSFVLCFLLSSRALSPLTHTLSPGRMLQASRAKYISKYLP